MKLIGKTIIVVAEGNVVHGQSLMKTLDRLNDAMNANLSYL